MNIPLQDRGRLARGLEDAVWNEDRLLQRLDQGMAPWVQGLQEAWGEEFPFLRLALARATAPWRVNVLDVRNDMRTRKGSTLIVVGSRGVPEKNQLNEQLLALLQGVKLCEDTDFQIFFTGGVWGLEETYAERPALRLAQDFMHLTSERYAEKISIDQFSLHTGHQARVIGNAIRLLRFTRIIICLPIEHIFRFGSALAYDIHEHASSGPFPSFFFFGNGAWDDPIPVRGWNAAVGGVPMSRAREAFGPVQCIGDEGVIIPTKLLGGEYGYGGGRLREEVDKKRNQNLVCPALSPQEMLQYFMSNTTAA